ncbi:MAG TPA: hypothetical protein PLY70_05745 [Saprospiraceae bacterium]|nr:hypothetical protein [Saprospiraceae bacterium]HPN69760.1 hypothetical protein [Saprospiraceae bacterium]
MNAFENILGALIVNIQRLDPVSDYEFYSPYAIIFSLENRAEKLIISATNDGQSVDIRFVTDIQIESDYGLEYCEYLLNDLKKEDELNLFIGDEIKTIRIAEYNFPDILGRDFIIKQGKYAGVELQTKKHKLLFQNNCGGWCDINDFVVELPFKEKWKWI